MMNRRCCADVKVVEKKGQDEKEPQEGQNVKEGQDVKEGQNEKAGQDEKAGHYEKEQQEGQNEMEGQDEKEQQEGQNEKGKQKRKINEDITQENRKKRKNDQELLVEHKKNIADKQKEMADWSQIKSKDELLKSNIRAVPSRLFPKRSNKAGSGACFTITGEELSRRVNPPENLTSQVVLGQYLHLGKGKEDQVGKSHLFSYIPRLVHLAREETPTSTKSIYSNFTLLAEEEVQELGKSLEEISSAVVNQSEVSINISKRLGLLTSASKEAAVKTTRTLITAAINELENSTELDIVTHGGIRLIQSVWNVLDSVLPSTES